MKLNVEKFEIRYNITGKSGNVEMDLYVCLDSTVGMVLRKSIIIEKEQINLVQEIMEDPNKAILNKKMNNMVGCLARFKLKVFPNIKIKSNINELMSYLETSKQLNDARVKLVESTKFSDETANNHSQLRW